MTATDNRSITTATVPLLSITCRPSPGVVSVAFTGEVDMATAADLQAALLDALATHRPAVLEVDLSACTFLDCAGVRVLLAVRSRAVATGCLVRVRRPQPLVRLVLEVTGVLALFGDPADTEAAATTATGSDIASAGASRAASRPIVLPV